MLCGVIIYHKNILKMYKKEWVDKCLDSIFSQSFQNFSIFELNYNNLDNDTIIPNNTSYKHYYWHKPMENHVYAMNFLLDKAFLDYNYDIIFNVNLDDYYDKNRFSSQIPWIIDEKYDIVSSNFILFEIGNIITQSLDVETNHTTNKEIRKMLLRNKNIICHPGVAYSNNFWKIMKNYNINDIPIEDLNLWKNSIQKGLKFKILDKYLVYHRIHSNQITATNRKKNPGFVLKEGIIVI